MKKAFTMIEVIFVIVIIGILAAVAIPKLALTRSDAMGAKMANALSTCINDAGDEYIHTGHFHHYTQDDNGTASCKLVNHCFTITENDSNGSLNVVKNSSNTEASCVEAQRIAQRNLLSSLHDFHF